MKTANATATESSLYNKTQMSSQDNLILSHTSALNAIRQYRINKNEITIVDRILHNKQNESYGKFEIIVQNQNLKYKNSLFTHHVWKHPLSKDSMIHLKDNIYCVCPELLLLQLTNILSFTNLYLLTLELCGYYSINPETSIFESVGVPISSICKIQKYIEFLKTQKSPIKGINKLSQILSFCTDNSASPMESRLYIKLCGPRNKGLYGCKNLEMNKGYKLSKKASIIAGQSIIYPDISSKSHKIAIEYDSAQFHENTQQGQKDKRRRDALTHDGWKVYTIVPSQINNVSTFHVVAMQILKDLGQNTRIRNKNFIEKRNQAFYQLM